MAASPSIWMQDNALLSGAMLWGTVFATVLGGVMAVAGAVAFVRWCWRRTRTVALAAALVFVVGGVAGFSPYVAPSTWELVAASPAPCPVVQQPPPNDGSGCDMV